MTVPNGQPLPSGDCNFQSSSYLAGVPDYNVQHFPRCAVEGRQPPPPTTTTTKDEKVRKGLRVPSSFPPPFKSSSAGCLAGANLGQGRVNKIPDQTWELRHPVWSFAGLESSAFNPLRI